jgi:D-alanyl-D-alanine carboxypeptidase/D-alanyl-D-alanine-endopeptidase (penicillin-binding protein 4)
MLRSAILMLWAASALPGASLLEQRIDQTIRTTREVGPGSFGIEVVQVATGKTLYALNNDKFFVPASNTKLFSTALALMRLGDDHRLTTRIIARQAPDASGRIDGDLILYGGGDPSMSFVQIPFAEDADPADPMAGIEAMAEELAARGIRVIGGRVVGDDSAFEWAPFPPGWGINDPVWEYGAPVSALSLGSNSIRVDLIPAAIVGDPAKLQITPALEYFIIDNRTVTAGSGDPRLEVRRLGSRYLQISGEVPRRDKPATLWLAVDDPALYAATALDDALRRRGISVMGEPAVRHRVAGDPLGEPAGSLLVERVSPPLYQLLRVTDKVSQNLWAELMLREVARVQTGVGTRRAGLQLLDQFLNEIGVPKEDYSLVDGSGLSRATLVKPSAVVRLLRWMYAWRGRDMWVTLLPVGGVDGTLRRRFDGTPTAKSILAKTGSLSHVAALSGYADSATYGELAFSIFVNNTTAPASEIRKFIDKIGLILLE